MKVRNDILKLLYATMLLELPRDRVREFWHGHPLKAGDAPVEDADVLRHIWEEDGHVDLAYGLSVLNSLEPFLVSQGIPALEFVDRFIAGLNKGAMVGVGSILCALAPLLRTMFSSRDVLHFANKDVLPGIVRKVVPSLDCRMVKHETRAGRASSVLLLQFDRPLVQGLRFCDPYLFFARPLQLAPTRFGLPPFDEVRLMSDTRNVDDIIEKRLFSFDKNEVRIHGRPTGSFVRFREYCRKNGLSPDVLDAPDRPVVEIAKGYRCPVRKREVLMEGCVYGAPFYLVGLRYRLAAQPPDHFLAPMINETISGKSEAWRKAAEKHADLLGELERKIVFSFTRSDETISANGRRLAKSGPALILRNILRRHVSSGKTEFSNREFTGDGATGNVPSDNFSLRLLRLSAILSEKLPEVSIVKLGRGQFRFQAPCRVVLKEL
jgi:hypothetical protein